MIHGGENLVFVDLKPPQQQTMEGLGLNNMKSVDFSRGLNSWIEVNKAKRERSITIEP